MRTKVDQNLWLSTVQSESARVGAILEDCIKSLGFVK